MTINFKQLKLKNLKKEKSINNFYIIYDKITKLNYFQYNNNTILINNNLLIYSTLTKFFILEYFIGKTSLLPFFLISIYNLIEIKLYKIELELIGIGYKWSLINNKLLLELGFSHKILIKLPNYIESNLIQNKLILKSYSKSLLSKLEFILKNIKYKDPYKGKGIKNIYTKLILKKSK